MRRFLVSVLLLLTVAPAPAPAAYEPAGTLGSTGHGVLRFPQAIAVAPDGTTVWVADQHSFLVQQFTAAGAFVRQIGGFGSGPGQFGRVSESGTIGGIGGLAVGPRGALYVLDSFNARIQQFTPEGVFVRQWGTLGSGPGQFNLGINGGIAVRGSDLYVADQDNHRVQRFSLDADGAPVVDGAGVPQPTAVWGSLGTGDGQLDHPEGIAISPNGDHAVFVADNRNNRVQRFSAGGAFEAKLGTFGNADGQFDSPYDVGVDAPNHLYVADNENHRVQQFDASSLAFQGKWGSFGTDEGELGFPRSLSALAGDPNGGVYVGDTSNDRVQAFDATGRFERAFGESGRAPGNFTIPGAVAVERDGGVLVLDTVNDRVERFAGDDGRFLGEWGKRNSLGYPTAGSAAGEFREPQGLAAVPDGGFYVADTGNHRVQRFAPDGSFLDAYGGTAPGSQVGRFRFPRGVAVEPDGDLVVADTSNDRVQRRDALTGAWSVLATGVEKPSAVAVAGDGRILVAETDADRLRVLRSSGATERTVAGLNSPEGVTVAPDGAVFASDTGADRVVRLAPGTYEPTDAFGEPGGEMGQLARPAGVAADAVGGVWVVDRYNNRVQRFATPAVPASDPVPVATPAPAPPSTPTTVRRRLDRVTLVVVPRRSARSVRSLRVRGRLLVAGSGSCGGRVRVVVRARRRILARRTVQVRRTCTYAATLRVLRTARTRLTVSARFLGSASLPARRARPVAVTVRRR